MANIFQGGAYINEIERKSYPIGTPSKGYDANGRVIPAQSSFLSANPSATVTPPAVKPTTTRSKYIDPATGQYFKTAQDYGNYVATKIPASKPAGDVPSYAGDAMTNPNQSTTQLESTARNLNNARNDIAVGATDPYNVGNKSGIAYSPQELNAIEKAYAGSHDPALNDVFARLKEKKAEEDAKSKREEQIFQTNENIRQWKATTGSKAGTTSDLFTQTQLNNGARNAGMTIGGFSQLDEDLQNFFVQPPTDIDPDTGKSYPMNRTFENLVQKAKTGDISKEDAADEIESSNLPESVKHYYIDQLPLTNVQKQSYLSKIWAAVRGK